MKKKIVSLKNISVSIDGVSILENNTLDVNEHDICAIVGPNGGGKTTILKAMLGMVKLDKGSISILGKGPKEARPYIGYVPQTSSLDSHFPINVWDVVLMGRLIEKGLFKSFSSEDKEKTYEALKAVNMQKHEHKPIGVLSGGERQRVFFARALINNPKLLLLDEPTANIDPKMKSGIYNLLYSLKNKTTIVLVTHDMGIIGSPVDMFACLNRELHCHYSKDKLSHALETVYHCPVDVLMRGMKYKKSEHK